jgi:hypothetical protein
VQPLGTAVPIAPRQRVRLGVARLPCAAGSPPGHAHGTPAARRLRAPRARPQCRNKCGLFLAYCCSFGAIAGAVVVLLLLRQAGGDMAIGVGSVCQTAMLCLSGLLAWLCKSSEASDYSLLGW